MNPSGSVHPRYTGLPETAINSEVMASKYAAEVSKLDNEDEKEYVLGAIAEWAIHFREEGLTVADKHLAVFGEMSFALQSAGKGDLTGKIAIAIADALKSALSEGRAAFVSVDKLELISETFLRGIDNLKKTTDALASYIPKKQVKATRKTKPGPIIPSGIPQPDPTKKQDQNGQSPENEGQTGMEIGEDDKDIDPTSEHASTSAKVPKELETTQVNQPESLRAQVRNHYSDTEFEAFGDTKKMALVYYYIENVLRISQSIITQNTSIRQMLFDIVDKRRVIRMCSKARESSVTTADLVESVEEAHEAIEACSKLYGNYKSEIIYDEETPILVIITISK